MTIEEFSNGFDTLLNSYKYKAEFGEQSSIGDINLDEYEKSIFLTQAQDKIVKSYFAKTLNSTGEGFDDSTRRQLDFSSLITVKELKTKAEGATPFNDHGIVISFEDLGNVAETQYKNKPLFIINEKVSTTDKSYVVIPINYRDYDRMMSRAYSEPLKRQAWRLFEADSNTLNTQVELILRTDASEFKSYKVRYIRRPRPIVLVDLTDTDNELSIDGIQEPTECELNPIVHSEILEEAVRLALISKGIETNEMKAARQSQ
jgi:hypothetical protein